MKFKANLVEKVESRHSSLDNIETRLSSLDIIESRKYRALLFSLKIVKITDQSKILLGPTQVLPLKMLL
jgi:hypothetical protein